MQSSIYIKTNATFRCNPITQEWVHLSQNRKVLLKGVSMRMVRKVKKKFKKKHQRDQKRKNLIFSHSNSDLKSMSHMRTIVYEYNLSLIIKAVFS